MIEHTQASEPLAGLVEIDLPTVFLNAAVFVRRVLDQFGSGREELFALGAQHGVVLRKPSQGVFAGADLKAVSHLAIAQRRSAHRAMGVFVPVPIHAEFQGVSMPKPKRNDP